MRGPLGVVALAAILASIGAIPRVLLASDALPGWLRPFTWSDVLYMWENGLAGGRLPYWDSGFYPPGIGYPSAVLSRAFDQAATYVAAWAVLQVLLAATVAALLVAAGDPRRALVRWALAPALLLHASTNFELLAVAPLVLAVLLLRRGQMLQAGAWLAVGTAAKLFPAVAVPAALLHARRAGPRTLLAATLVFAAVVAAFFLPGLGAPHSTAETLGRYSVGATTNLDSIWGVARRMLLAVGADADTIILVLTLTGLALTYALVVVPASWRARDAAVPVALSVVTLLLWSRLFSAQYSLWVLPFFTLLPVTTRTFALFIAADAAVFATVYPLTLVPWQPSDVAVMVLYGGLVAAIVLRHFALLLTAIEIRRLAGAPSALDAIPRGAHGG